MKKRFFHQFSLVLSLFIAFNLFGQENVDSPLSQKGLSIQGLWENGGRFIEFSKKDEASLDMRIVLKPYYRFVYEKMGNFSTSMETVEDSKSRFYLRIRYPYVKKAVVMPVCIQDDFFFTSFYKKIPYEVKKESADNLFETKDENYEKSLEDKKSPLDGFWVEQGSPDGILLYPNEAPESIDAYFFTGDDYIRFRYWLDDLEYNDKKVVVKGNDGTGLEFPRLLKRGSLVYSCVTNTGSVLRNYETGKYIISSDTNAENTKGLFLSFKSLGAGPGTHAAPDTYPKAQFSVLENLPLYILDEGRVFAMGSPFLIRSQVKDLDAEIEKHNSKRRPPPEPSIPNEDL
ncbi:hypothetical protein E4O03_03905 [Treponema sp. OMZ 792]|uniref:deoxyribodipyrimidine photo-lyase n=1 Tax=unclassified Treponema TaxID=2638727 RepID=UPI0020A40C0D|nr:MULTISPECIES: deoxyribodipyrimidine photo-lyase [unclassified Treponema]UTC75870.1 hypothetical protein E4O03_03905 [Treponema sp. OMZ 792]UTC78324.1 hypothetical protein E4O04_10050 [Treponema sp. OMZ 799]UTC79870.1 hypothetical protein E4O07_03920 [Treponema sp. OMZ 798]